MAEFNVSTKIILHHYDEAANEIVIEPARPGIAFAPHAMDIRVQLPIGNLVVEDGAWSVWYTVPARGLTSFSAELDGVANSFFNFPGGELDSLHMTLNGARDVTIAGSAKDAALTVNGTGSIVLHP